MDPKYLMSLSAVFTILGSLIVGNSQVKQAQEHKVEIQERPEPMRERNIELTITPVGYDVREGDYVPQASFPVGEQINIALTMTNGMEHGTAVGWGNSMFQNRLKLEKDGEEVAYLPGLANKISKMEKYGYVGDMQSTRLPPNVPVRVGLVYLKEWYPPLEAGHYRLKVKHIFFGEERPIHSNEATFDVVPRSNP